MKQPRIALLTIGDGRDRLLQETIGSLETYVQPRPDFACYIHVDDRAHELGFGGAIQEGWRRLRERADAFDYVFHLEEDWRFDRPLDLAAMTDLLDAYPALAQVALRRGAVNAAERAAGGVVEMWPREYLEKSLFPGGSNEAGSIEYPWLEHGLYFTTNPCLYRRDLIEAFDWPDGPGSEAAFTHHLRSYGYGFALWGARRDGPWITHTGTDRRTGMGY